MILLPQSLESLGLQASAISPSNNQIFEHFHHKEMVNMWSDEYAKYPEFLYTVYQYQSITGNVYHIYYIHEKKKVCIVLFLSSVLARLNFFVQCTGVRTHFSLLQHWESNQSSAPDRVLTYCYASAEVLKHVWVVLH